MIRFPIRLALALPAAVLTPIDAAARAQSSPVHDPTKYVAPAREFVLEVDPSRRDGGGPAAYRLTRSGIDVWAGERPFTLLGAAVVDDGRAVGWAYTGGSDSARGEMQVILLGADGTAKVCASTPRGSPVVMHGNPVPAALGIFAQPKEDRFVVRVVDPKLSSNGETWCGYRLGTGEPLGPVALKDREPERDRIGYVVDARPVAGTPLVLQGWLRYDETMGARFALVDERFETVWALDLPKDYEVPGDERAADRLVEEIRRDGAILRTDRANEFEIRLVAEKKRARFVVRADEKADRGWRVDRDSDEPYVPAAAPAPSEQPLSVKLPLLGSFEFGKAVRAPETAVRGARDICLDDRGRFGWIRRSNSDTKTRELVIVDAAGRLVKSLDLGDLRGSSRQEELQAPKWTWVHGDRWLATVSEFGPEGRSQGWWVDVVAEKVQSIDGFECPSIDALAPLGDGGFVALASYKQKYTSTDNVIAFGPDAKVRWRIEQDYEDPSKLFSPKDLTVASTGQVVVLDVVRKLLQVYGSDGAFRKAIDLESAWGSEPNYPADITADVDGGVIVRDFDGTPPIWRMDLEGKVRSKFGVRRADGGSLDAWPIRCAPDGRLWTTEGDALLRLSDDGGVDLTLGQAPSAEFLEQIHSITVDSHKRLYASDRRSHAIHVFDAEGVRLRVLRPAPTDAFDHDYSRGMAVASDGSVYLAERTRYLAFAPDGTRRGWEELGLDRVTETWRFPPTGEDRWVMGYHAVFLAGADGRVKATIERQPDRRWFRELEDVAVAPDGSIAVLTSPGVMSRGAETAVHLYTSTGDPIRSFPLPSDVRTYAQLAWSGRWIVLVLRAGKALVVDGQSGRSMTWAPLPGEDGEPRFDPFVTAGGSELWIVEFTSRTVRRFALPKT